MRLRRRALAMGNSLAHPALDMYDQSIGTHHALPAYQYNRSGYHPLSTDSKREADFRPSPSFSLSEQSLLLRHFCHFRSKIVLAFGQSFTSLKAIILCDGNAAA